MKKIRIVLTLLSFSLFVSAQNKVDSKCYLWEPKNYCSIPDTINISYKITCSNFSLNTLSCKVIKFKKRLHGVHLRFSSKTDSTFYLTSKFENISLKRKIDGKIIHPYALMMIGTNFWGSKTIEYWTNQFEAKECIINFKLNEPYDLIMLFESAEDGDKVKVDDFTDVEIEN